MQLTIKPSDLQYRYPKVKQTRDLPKFSGLPDPNPFDRDDLYDVIPMFEGVMNALQSDDAAVLHRMEEVLSQDVPRWVATREEVYSCLLQVMQGLLETAGGRR